MTRILIAFLVGSLVTVGCMIAADYRSGLLMMAGAIVMLMVECALVFSVRRARALSRFIEAVCEALDGHVSKHQARVEREPSTIPQPVQDLTSALVNFGMARKEAGRIAAESFEAGGTFPEMLRRAMMTSAKSTSSIASKPC
jgi:hypothetical protein